MGGTLAFARIDRLLLHNKAESVVVNGTEQNGDLPYGKAALHNFSRDALDRLHVFGIGEMRVCFILPEAPFGSLAEQSLVHSAQCISVPDALDDTTAAAIANPGMSAWAALVERARLRPGETVLVNGATGTAGRLAVQLAKYLGAGRVIGTGRNTGELKEQASFGAEALPFALDGEHPLGAK